METQDNQPNLSFKPAKVSDKPLLYRWLKQSHISEWIHSEGLENTLTSLDAFLKAIESNPHTCRQTALTQHWLGYDGDHPFTYPVCRCG